MATLNELGVEHAKLKAQADCLLAVVAAPVPDPAAAMEARRDLGRCLQAHCVREDREVYDWLLASGDAVATPITRRSRQEFGRLEARFGSYVAAWPVSKLAGEWEAFRDATQAIVAALLDRIAHEEEMLYPLVRKVKARRAARASAVEQRP